VQCTRTDALASNGAYPPITLSVNIAASAPASVTNNVSVSGGGDTNTLNNSASDVVAVIPPPADLTITKTHTGNFQQGQSFVGYQIVVSNAGSSPTVGLVTVTDTLPTGLTFVSMFGGGWNCSQTTCTRTDALAAGASYSPIQLTVNVANNAPASVTNTAVVSGGGEVNLANDTANDVTTITPTPDLAITKTHVGDFTVGLPGTYTITVSNVGGAATVGSVNMNDFLPQGMTATSITATGWTCSPVPTSFVNCTRSDALDAGSSYPSIVVVVAITGGFLNEVNSANVNGGGELNFANDNASDPTVVNAPVLAITKTHSPATFIVGQTGTYTITVSNTGATATSGSVSNPVTVNDFLPQGMTATDLSASTGWTCSPVPTTFVTCTRSDALAPAASYPAIVMAVRIDGSLSATITNTASVTGGGDLGFHNASDTAPVTAPVLGITKSHVGSFTVGQTGDYTITVSNSGAVATVGTVNMNDFLPFGMTATAINATGWTCSTVPTTFVNCTRSDSLAAGGSYPAITATVSLDSSVGPSVTNFASVSGGGDLGTRGASDQTTINVPDLSITGSHSGNFFAGQVGAVYTVNISNVGTTATAGGTVNFNDTLFAGLTATAASGTGWSCTSSFPSTFVFCTRPAGTLAGGASYPPITLTLNVTPDAPASVTSILQVNGIGDANFSNNIAFDNISISRVAVIPSGSGSATVAAGNAASFVFTANLATTPPVAGTVTFSASGLPPNSNASLSPSSLTQSGPVALTINTSGNGHVASLQPAAPGGFSVARLAAFFPFAGVMGFVLLMKTRRKLRLRPVLVISFFALLLGFAGCGGGGTPPPPPPPVVTPPGTYTITVTATSSNPGIAPVVTKVTLIVQ